MRTIILVAAMVMVLAVTCSYSAGRGLPPDDQTAAEVKGSLSQTLDWWRDGRFADVYDHSSGGKLTREAFSRKLGAAPLKPACCWEKLQEVTVRVEGDDRAVVRAKIGLEGSGGTEFKTGTWKLVREESFWRLSRNDILSLAGSTKKKRSTHRIRRTP